MTQQRWLGAVKNLGCVGCHQLGQLSTRTIPASLGTFASGADAWQPPRAVGSGRRDDVRPAERTRPGVVQALRRLDRSRRERRAAAQPPEPPAGRRAQHRRHAARLDEREAVPARPDLERSTPSDRQRQRAALRIAGVQLGPDADSRSGREQGDDVQDAGAGSADAAQPRPGTRGGAQAARRVAVLGRRGDLGHARQQPQLDARSRRPRVAGRGGARTGQPRVLPRRLVASVGEALPDRSQRPRRSPSSNRRRRSTRSSTRASARITSSSATTPTTRSGRAAAARCSAG